MTPEQPLPVNYLQSAHTPQHLEEQSATEGVYVCVCCAAMLRFEGLCGQLQSYFRGPLGLFIIDPSVTDNHLPPMSIAHKCLCSSSLRSHQSSSALRMYSIWGLAADVAYTQQQKQHTSSKDKTCFFNGNKNTS